MNRYKLFPLMIIVCSMSLLSCQKFETEPLDTLDKDFIFDRNDKSGIYAEQYLNNLYTYLPDGFNRVDGNLLDAGTDDALPTLNNTKVEYFINGKVDATNYPDHMWVTGYEGIRKINIFLNSIDVVPVVEIKKQYWKAEARFIRSLLYFEMVKRYGGVPLLGDTVFTVANDLNIPRNNYEHCVDYIVSECDDIKDSVRLDAPMPATATTVVSDADWGRITKGCVLALKSRTLLYAASPLFNGGGFETDPVKKALAGYPTNDPSRWQKALTAAEELVNMVGSNGNKFDLSTYTTIQTPSQSVVVGFANIFTGNASRKNCEIILAKQRAATSDVESNNGPVGYTGTMAGKGLTSPTQDLVDAFTDTFGVAITAAGTKYLANVPYLKRDLRFYSTIFYNNSKWLNRTVETFNGGKDRPGGNASQTKTGYYMRKFMGAFTNNQTSYSTQTHNFVIFRFGEAILNYAEALNETGKTSEAGDQIIRLRKRAGILPGTATTSAGGVGLNRYGVPASISQDAMRTLIQNERRVELAFEEHRFWDIRRWKKGQEFLNNKNLRGMRITKSGTTFAYATENVQATVFPVKMYHMPIPYSELTKNNKLIQNEGWD